ncbi:hypothetical protein [Massilia sp. TSP1-1-2]|uniref:hypothetical protein n=1 Tax=unclassified Massilia TaxID=2609279 RepID=UPI003CF36892
MDTDHVVQSGIEQREQVGLVGKQFHPDEVVCLARLQLQAGQAQAAAAGNRQDGFERVERTRVID